MPDVPPPLASSRYSRLYQSLTALPAEQQTVTLTFPEIEQIIRWALPSSAHLQYWWTARRTLGTMPPATRAWLAAGWYVASVQGAPLAVTFQRGNPGPRRPQLRPNLRWSPRRPP